jgi:hypothetical protein
MRNTNHEAFTDRLSEYLDGTLPLVERVQLRRHLAECTSCAAVLAELRAVVARANDLRAELPPERDLFQGVVAGIEGRSTPTPWSGDGEVDHAPRTRRVSLRSPKLAAASIALLALTGIGVWLARPKVPAVVVEAAPLETAEQPLQAFDDQRTDDVIAELERTLAENRTLLDPSTVGVIESNLAILDSALEDARRALAEDPGSTYLSHHLADTMRRKLQLLRDANALAQQ